MTPQALRPDVVLARLAVARRLLDHLATLGAVDAARVAGDLGLRLQLERLLTQLVEIAVNVNSHVVSVLRGTPPADYRSSFTAAGEVGLLDAALVQRLVPSAGLRDIVVHEYLEVDVALLASAAERALTDYGDYVRAVSAWLAARPEAAVPPS